jgi:nitrogenase-stabilizing/protective protein
MFDDSLDEDLQDLVSAEEFLDYFEIDYEPAIVHVNRLHILQRFHDYLEQAGVPVPDGEERRAAYASLLDRAYQDFVDSDAQTEKVFKVFRMHEPQEFVVPLENLMQQVKRAAPV